MDIRKRKCLASHRFPILRNAYSLSLGHFRDKHSYTKVLFSSAAGVTGI